MPRPYRFTFRNIERELRQLLALGYKVITCAQYAARKQAAGTGWPADERVVVLRVDVDMSLKKAERLAAIFRRLDITASFFIRLHASEYNPYSFEGYRIVRSIVDAGHELGYHAELLDAARIWGEDPVSVLDRDLRIMNQMFGVSVVGAASHGGMTGTNNLDFWTDRRPADHGLVYEAYDREPAFNLFHESIYVSDSAWTHWKTYDHGALIEGDLRSPADHGRDGQPLIFMLIHPDTFYDRHFYE